MVNPPALLRLRAVFESGLGFGSLSVHVRVDLRESGGYAGVRGETALSFMVRVQTIIAYPDTKSGR